jgi:hypothetical protein
LLDYARARVKEARNNIELAQIRQKCQYDKRHRRHDSLAVGDKAFLVLDLRPVPSLPRSKINWPKWGPFEVLEISLNGKHVKLDFQRTQTIDWVSTQHVEKLAPDEFRRMQPEPYGTKEGEELWERAGDRREAIWKTETSTVPYQVERMAHESIDMGIRGESVGGYG